MRISKLRLSGFMSIILVFGMVGLVVPPPSEAVGSFGGIKKIFPPCRPGTREQRFVVSKDGLSVCDNKTGLWWEQSPSTATFVLGTGPRG